MTRVLALLLLATVPAWGGEAEWQQLLEKSHANLERTQAALEKNFSLSEYDRWDVSQETGELIFTGPGKDDVVAKVVFIGSYAFRPQTWLWAWANRSVDESLTKALHRVQEHGRTHGFEALTKQSWDSEEREGWDMAAVTNYLLDGKGVYRASSESSILWVVITDIRRAR